MSVPRQVLRGAVYLITRRCAQRTYLLRPSELTNQIVLYMLAVAANRYGVRVHAFCVLSNHVHLVVSDPDARLPEFHQYLNAFIARAVNASLGRFESFWAPGSYSAVTLVAAGDIVNETSYTLANPVAAGLVPSARMWPGLWSAPEQFGTTLEVERPRHFFAKNGSFPERATLTLSVPPGFASVDEFREQVVESLERREAEAQQRWGGRFLGLKRVLRQDPNGRPRTREPRRQLNPRIAARNPADRIEALGRRKTFLGEYRVAWRERRAGNKNAVFPAGTYLLRVMHGVPCVGCG